MSEFQCENCQHPVTSSHINCTFCGFPQRGTRQEKITYNGRLLKFRDLVEESDKSIKSVFSLAIIFVFMGLVVVAFSLTFSEQHYHIAVFYIISGVVYYLFGTIGKKSAYLMVILALFFYMAHTIVEFSYGFYPKSPVDASDSFTESKGASIVYAMIPLGYILIRVALMIVLIKFLYLQIRLKSQDKMVRFIRSVHAKH
jgi:hypothetical protein